MRHKRRNEGLSESGGIRIGSELLINYVTVAFFLLPFAYSFAFSRETAQEHESGLRVSNRTVE